MPRITRRSNNVGEPPASLWLKVTQFTISSNPKNIKGHSDPGDMLSFCFEATSYCTLGITIEPALNKSGVTAAVMAFQKNLVVAKAANQYCMSAEAYEANLTSRS